jgi:small subunit ribosomal protein S11
MAHDDQTQGIFEELPQSESAAASVSSPEGSKKDLKKRGKKKAVHHVPVGNVYIKATYNNTIVTFTDAHGNVLAQSSAGRLGFKGPKKSTPYAASLIVKDASEKVKKYGLMEVSVFVRGVASGREGALRALNMCGMTINALKDVTPVPHNGCRPRKVRRV